MCVCVCVVHHLSVPCLYPCLCLCPCLCSLSNPHLPHSSCHVCNRTRQPKEDASKSIQIKQTPHNKQPRARATSRRRHSLNSHFVQPSFPLFVSGNHENQPTYKHAKSWLINLQHQMRCQKQQHTHPFPQSAAITFQPMHERVS